MPWKVTDVLEQRSRFVLEYESGEWTMAELCRDYGVSRETGYKWVARYQAGGIRSLEDLRRAPKRHPNQTPAEVEQYILAERREHPHWGARKLRAYLEARQSERSWPAASTIGDLLKREGLVAPRRKRGKTPPYTQPFQAADESNQVWCGDFKGWFLTGDGERIDPLTISDAHARFLIRCQAVEAIAYEPVQPIFEAAFREFGMPRAVRSDNGVPFASRSIAGLSRLAIYFMKLGIVPERIEPGHPEQNGRHERMHKTLKAETATPPASDRRGQQRRFDQFRREYNEQRPHEALGQRTPASIYVPSPRSYPRRVPEPEYGTGVPVRRVQARGEIYWKHQPVFLSETLRWERVALEPLDEGSWTVYFADFAIALFDSRELRIKPLRGGPVLRKGLWK